MFASSKILSIRSACNAEHDSRRLARRCSGRSIGNRQGLTLVEVLLATTILVVSLAALAQQNASGTRAALRSHLETESAIRCQSQLNRLLTQNGSLQSQLDVPFLDDNRWRWSATVSASQFPELSLLTVRVSQSGNNQDISEFSLSRLFTHKAASSTNMLQAGVNQ